MKNSAALLYVLALSAPGVAAVAAPVSIIPIHTVQGTGAVSPLVGQTVTVQGIVTGDFSGAAKFDGFYSAPK